MTNPLPVYIPTTTTFLLKVITFYIHSHFYNELYTYTETVNNATSKTEKNTVNLLTPLIFLQFSLPICTCKYIFLFTLVRN